jgi:hypothetical protein
MKKVVVWLSAVAGAAAVAFSVSTVASVSAVALTVSTTSCNSGGSCTYVSKCKGDVPLTPNQVTSCENARNASNCGGDYSSYLGCIQNNQVCNEDGTTNVDQTNALCNIQFAAFQNCCYGGEGGAVNDGGYPQCNP